MVIKTYLTEVKKTLNNVKILRKPFCLVFTHFSQYFFMSPIGAKKISGQKKS